MSSFILNRIANRFARKLCSPRAKDIVAAVKATSRAELGTTQSAAVQATINCYPQKLDENHWMLAPSPGEVLVVDLADEVRGSKYVLGRWFLNGGKAIEYL